MNTIKTAGTGSTNETLGTKSTDDEESDDGTKAPSGSKDKSKPVSSDKKKPRGPLQTCDPCTQRRDVCAQHGGVDCSRGPDDDGSVICRNGYADSTASYECK